jgi:predicted ArsR family transcriptional regulator
MAMQKTRRLILDYLKEHGQATVDELAAVLRLNSVTVRHHLDILRSAGLVAEPTIRHRNTPGRPQYCYSLTEEASQQFPKNYCDLAGKLIEEVKASTPSNVVDLIFEGVATRLAQSAPELVPGEALPERLDRAVAYLNSQGYVAHWEKTEAGCLLQTCNCPYEALADGNPELCGMDLTLVTNLLGVAPERVSRVVEGAASCAYLFPTQAGAEANKIERNLTN